MNQDNFPCPTMDEDKRYISDEEYENRLAKIEADVDYQNDIFGEMCDEIGPEGISLLMEAIRVTKERKDAPQIFREAIDIFDKHKKILIEEGKWA